MNVPLFLCSTWNEYKDVGERFALKGIKRIRSCVRLKDAKKIRVGKKVKIREEKEGMSER